MLVNKSSKTLHKDININANNSTIKGESILCQKYCTQIINV